ncbi:DUF1566 domain-containing protein [Fundidesulfovibrio agrisoli]|uniref:Lcl C-terminal domain-containing protein n=1 Tax=Fundidesulfovibrio agrisoli TaxID=2922717 RepID=UPI001FAD2E0C|nr:DUF1566 domain-containing protein [Fundidesulfovibrio agrisoli]
MSSIARNQSQPCSPLHLPFLLLTGILATSLFVFASVPARAYTLPDTGLTQCFDTSESAIPCPARGMPFYGQDGNFRGAQPRYLDNGNGTAKDQITGLTWQTAGASGVDGRTWDEAVTACQNLSLGSVSGWRLPTEQELLSIVNYGPYNWATTLPGPDPDGAPYWSSTSMAGATGEAWTVDYSSGTPDHKAKTDAYSVRCVSGTALPGPNLTDKGNGTVSDASTGLVWEKAASASASDWETALNYCSTRTTGGFKDWRLPNQRELLSLANFSLTNPTLNPVFDTATPIWSSTSGGYSPTAWRGDFTQGSQPIWSISKVEWKTATLYSRCVRGGLPLPGVPGVLVILLNQ